MRFQAMKGNRIMKEPENPEWRGLEGWGCDC